MKDEEDEEKGVEEGEERWGGSGWHLSPLKKIDGGQATIPWMLGTPAFISGQAGGGEDVAGSSPFVIWPNVILHQRVSVVRGCLRVREKKGCSLDLFSASCLSFLFLLSLLVSFASAPDPDPPDVSS